MSWTISWRRPSACGASTTFTRLVRDEVAQSIVLNGARTIGRIMVSVAERAASLPEPPGNKVLTALGFSCGSPRLV